MTYILIFLQTLSRFLPHPANFTPVGAVSIFATKKYGWKKAAGITLISMIISDIFLGFGWYSVFVYLGSLSYILFEKIFTQKKFSPVISAVLGSLSFFAITNLAVWLGPWYTHDLAGFTKCFTLAVPFYKNTILGDLTFTAALFALDYMVGKIKRRNISWHLNLKVTNLTQKS